MAVKGSFFCPLIPSELNVADFSRRNFMEQFGRRRTRSDRDTVRLSCRQTRPLTPHCVSPLATTLSKTRVAFWCGLSLMDYSEYKCVPGMSCSSACANDVSQYPGWNQGGGASDSEAKGSSGRDGQRPKHEHIETGRLYGDTRGADSQGRVLGTNRGKRSGIERQLVRQRRHRKGHRRSGWSMSCGGSAW